MIRSHRRRLVALASGSALALSTGLLAACSAGQLAATSLITSSVPGAQGSVTAQPPNGTIQVANATVDYNGPKGYQAGESAPLSLLILNNTTMDITLTSVNSTVGQVVVATGTAAGTPSVCESSARPIQANPSTGAPTSGVGPSLGASGGLSPQGPTGTPSTKSSAKPTGSARPSGTASPSDSASPSPEQSSAAPEGSTDISVTVKAYGCVALTRQSAQFLQITGLSGPVVPGKTIGMGFTFRSGNEQWEIGTQASPLAIPVGVPSSPDSRAPQAVPSATE